MTLPEAMSAADTGITAEVFVSGCPLCEQAFQRVSAMAGPADTIIRQDLTGSQDALDRAEELGITTIPSVALDGRLAACCATTGVEESVLRNAGLGAPR